MDKLLKVGKLVAYIAEAVLAACVATETVKKFSDSHKARKKYDKGRVTVEAEPCPITD